MCTELLYDFAEAVLQQVFRVHFGKAENAVTLLGIFRRKLQFFNLGLHLPTI